MTNDDDDDDDEMDDDDIVEQFKIVENSIVPSIYDLLFGFDLIV